jgi:polyisoprenoid-binding protein YceI
MNLPSRLLLAAALVAFSGALQAPAHAQLQEGSRMWIEGSSTVNTFMCAAARVAGEGRIQTASLTSAPNAPQSPARPAASLSIPVETFDCGKRAMNRDLYAALNSAAFPDIEFELRRAEVISELEGAGEAYELRATGHLRIAGSEREVILDLTVVALGNNRFRARGKAPLLMTDFGIEPPTALLGLVRARDRIVVHFDLIAALPRTGDPVTAYARE